MSADVVVVGLGGMGSAAAYHLACRGLSVVGLERFGPGHDQGSSHGGTRIIRQSYFEDPAYVPLLLRAYELWDQLGQDSGRDVHRLTGGLYIGPEHSTTFAGSRAAAEQWGLAHEVLSAADVRSRFPAFDPASDQLGLFEAAGGFARPEETVLAHVELATRAGADLRFDTVVTGWTDHGDHVEVQTSAGPVTAEQVVVCPGAWAPQLLADLELGIRVERQVMYWIEPIGAVDLSSIPVYIQENSPREDGDVEQVYGFPAVDGPAGGAKVAVTVACGFSGHGFKFVPVVGEVLADLVQHGTTEHPIGLFDPARLEQR